MYKYEGINKSLRLSFESYTVVCVSCSTEAQRLILNCYDRPLKVNEIRVMGYKLN